MTVYFPSYYKEFRCIADRCRHSCCVNWEIGLDDATMAKYSSLEGTLGDDILSHISMDESVIRLCDNGSCPFLDERGLCRIISSIGEENVSDICREHPRFYHRVGDRIEGGIGASCEEAARIILSSNSYSHFFATEREVDVAEETDFDSLTHREYIYSLISDSSLSYDQRMNMIREKYDLPTSFDPEYWNEILKDLEYLDPSREGNIRIGEEEAQAEIQSYLIGFFAYLVFRHVSIADSYDNLRARVGFCLLLSSVLENMIAERDLTFADICECARIISEEIEYSEDNTASLIFEMECII